MKINLSVILPASLCHHLAFTVRRRAFPYNHNAGQEVEQLKWWMSRPPPFPKDTHPHNHYINSPNDSGTSALGKKKFERSSPEPWGEDAGGGRRAQSAVGADSDHTSHRYERTGTACRHLRHHRRCRCSGIFRHHHWKDRIISSLWPAREICLWIRKMM